MALIYTVCKESRVPVIAKQTIIAYRLQRNLSYGAKQWLLVISDRTEINADFCQDTGRWWREFRAEVDLLFNNTVSLCSWKKRGAEIGSELLLTVRWLKAERRSRNFSLPSWQNHVVGDHRKSLVAVTVIKASQINSNTYQNKTLSGWFVIDGSWKDQFRSLIHSKFINSKWRTKRKLEPICLAYLLGTRGDPT